MVAVFSGKVCDDQNVGMGSFGQDDPVARVVCEKVHTSVVAYSEVDRLYACLPDIFQNIVNTLVQDSPGMKSHARKQKPDSLTRPFC